MADAAAGGATVAGARDAGAADAPVFDLRGLTFRPAWNGEMGLFNDFSWQDPDDIDLAPGEIVDVGTTSDAAKSHSPTHAHFWTIKKQGGSETGRSWAAKPTDLHGARYLSFWLRVTGTVPPRMLVSLRMADKTCSARLMDYATPGGQLGVSVPRYDPDYANGTWRQIVIPVVDITEDKPACQTATEIVLRAGDYDVRDQVWDYTLLLDDVGFYY
jgi:hypothetical protein